MRAQTLVAVNYGDRDRDIAPVLAFVGDGLLDHKVTEQRHWRSGDPQIVHMVVFDADRVRNTEVHGAGFRAGFTVHIES